MSEDLHRRLVGRLEGRAGLDRVDAGLLSDDDEIVDAALRRGVFPLIGSVLVTSAV